MRAGVVKLVASLPVGGTGLALGYAGLSAAFTQMRAMYGYDSAALDLIERAMLWGVVCVVLLYTVRMCVAPSTAISELSNRNTISAYGSLCMCVMAVSAYPMGTASEAAGRVLLVVAWVGAACVTARYLYILHTRQIPPLPSCFPATVHFALIASSGTAIHLAPAARDIAMGMGLCMAVVLTPYTLWNSLTTPTYARSPHIWPLAAPWALLARGFFTSDQGRFLPSATGHVLFAMSAFTFVCAVYGTALRGRDVWAPHPSMNMFTFPTTTVATAGAQYAQWTGSTMVKAYAWATGVLALVAVIGVTAVFVWALPSWVRAAATDSPGPDTPTPHTPNGHSSAVAPSQRQLTETTQIGL